MEENILISNNLPSPHSEKVVREHESLSKKALKPWKRSLSLDCPSSLRSDNVVIRTSKSLPNLEATEDLCLGKFSPPRTPDKVEAQLNPPKSPSLNNGFNHSDDQMNREYKTSDHEDDQTVVLCDSNSMDQIAEDKFTITSEKVGVSKGVFSFDECGKDNKEEIGRCIDFIERDLLKLSIRVADQRYKVEECQIVLTPLTKEGECNEDMERINVSISKNEIQCVESLVKSFIQEGVKSYKSKLMKELGMEREIEYVSLDSPPSSPTSTSGNSKSSSQILIHNNTLLSEARRPSSDGNSSIGSNIAGPSGTKIVLSPQKSNYTTILTLEDLPDNLVKEVQFMKKAPSPDSESTEILIPTIPGMKTVPLNLPPSKSIAGYIFIPSTKCPSLLYFFPHDLSLKEVLEATNRTANSLAQFLMSNEIVTQSVPMKNLIANSSPLSPVNGVTSGVRKRGRPLGSKKLRMLAERSQVAVDQSTQDNNGFVCTCRNKPAETQNISQTEEEISLRDNKTVTMVDCDDCGKSFKEGRLHKCQKKKVVKKELPLIPCELCERSFTHKAHLVNHMRSHKDYLKTTVLCRLCNKRFKKKGEIAMHRATKHPESLEHYCDCGLKFRSLTALNQHKRTHKEDGTILCVYCKGTFEINHYEKFHKNECTVNPINQDSRTDGKVTVTTKKPIAKRSKSLRVEEETSTEYYYEEEILEGYDVSKEKKGKGKRRYSDFSSDSETEVPPRKVFRAQDGAGTSGAESPHYIDEEVIVSFESTDAEDGNNRIDVEELLDFEC